METNIATTSTPAAGRKNVWKGIAGTVIAALIIAWAALGSAMLREPDRDYSTTRTSDSALFTMTILPDKEPIPINTLHTWKLHVETTDGKPVENAQIAVDGDMPEHGHGLPTRPKVTRYLGNGNYLVEGMKFQMTGWWVMEFDVTALGKTDHVAFNLLLK